ncbi:porin family protein [Flectobacillus sp. BAB-3569]|uniref:porin family protein n=1 Tax=Flectobacillus sp. BAB-3569 TaxID=1509483 RepID=UPI000BA42557|nr:porin family protein [Flectobacillus sp. BAB-3569]PAC32362.1 hypothetical protein BWI92_03875 [Flectobacillus sp. BAB-3569]
MKKTFGFLALFMLLTMVSKAQFFTLGIKGGVNLSQLKLGNELNMNSIGANFQQSLDTKTGYVGGVYMRIGNKVFIQPEFLLSAKGGSLNILKGGSTADKQTVDIEYTNIDIPVLLGFRMSPFRINGGPLASFNVSKGATLNESIKAYTQNGAEDAFKKASYGYQVGGGLDLGALSLDVRYEGSLSDVTSAQFANDMKFTQKGNLWQLTLGLKIL